MPIKGAWNKVARLAGVSPQTVYRIAWGDSHDHRLTTYQRISAAIDLVQLEESAKVGAGKTAETAKPA